MCVAQALTPIYVDIAFRWLERAHDERGPVLRNLQMYTAVDPRCSHPDFSRSLTKAGVECSQGGLHAARSAH